MSNAPQPQPQPVGAHALSVRALWQAHPAFSAFLLARFCGTLANQMMMVALGWQMYDLTLSAWDLGLVGLYQFVPALLLTLPAGHVIDHYKRSHIFMLCMLLQAVVAASLAVTSHSGVVSRDLVLGMCRAFQMPVQQALTPLLVPRVHLAQAVTLSSSAMQCAVITGPALGGALYILGVPVVYSVCCTLMLSAALCMLRVRYGHRKRPSAISLGEVFAGLRFVWQQKIVLGAISLDLFAVLLGGATALLPIFARDILHTGPWELGLLRSAPAVGALLVSLVLLRLPLRRHCGHWLFGSVAVFGLATLVFAVSHSIWLSLLALAVTGAADNISVVLRQTLVQIETPDALRGRVSAVNSIFIGASNQLGEFESGVTAALLGAQASVLLGGFGTLVIAAIWRKAFPSLALRDALVPGGRV